MDCREAEPLLERFADGELSSPALVSVARHAGGCARCDAALRELGVVREAIARTVQADGDALDLGALWVGVTRRVGRHEARRAWMRRLRTAPAWGVAAALAAAAVLWLRGAPSEPPRVARARPNDAVIERLDSTAHVELRRDRKQGTMLIMVSDVDTVLP
jgi:anti-sigma factor RsiW